MKKDLLLLCLIARSKKYALFIFFISLFFINTNITAAFFDPVTWTNSDFDTDLRACPFSYNGRYIAAVGTSNTPTYDLVVYGWDGSAIKDLGTGAKVALGGEFHCSWSLDDKYIAVCGNNGTADFMLFSWNGTTLTNMNVSKDWAGYAHGTSWNSDGKTLAISGVNGLIVYSWDGTNLITKDTKLPSNAVDCCAWSGSGQYLAAGLTTGAFYVYSWNGSTLNSTIYSGTLGNLAEAVAWSPDDKYLAVGGRSTSNDALIAIYAFNGSTLTLITSFSLGATGGDHIREFSWTSDGKYLAVGGIFASGTTTYIYSWNGSNLSLVDSISKGTSIYRVDWSSDNMYLSTACPNASPRLTVYRRTGAIDGISTNVYFNHQHPFINGGMAVGDVQFKKGFNLGRGQTLTLDLLKPIEGPINLEYSSTLYLKNNVHFGSSATLTSSHGIIDGNNNTLFLDNNLNTIDNTVLHIATNTVIDGQGHALTLARWSQILVDTAVTLTLRNMTLKNTINNQGFPPIKCAASTSKLALDNVTLWTSNDFHFNEGQLFIHNDVVFTGTSELHYLSSKQSYIAPNSMLTFEPNTSFFYDTVSTYTPNPTGLNFSASNKSYPRNNQLINLQDITSALYLDGCQLHVSHTGLRLTKGQMFFENTTTITNKQITNIAPSNTLTDLGTNAHIDFWTVGSGIGYEAVWSPNGKYIAGVGGLNKTFKIYGWNGTTLLPSAASPLASKTMAVATYGCDWSPDQKYIAVTGNNGASGLNSIVIYEWDGTYLTYKTAQTLGVNWTYHSTWSPDGKYLATACDTVAKNFTIFSWNGLSLTETTSKTYSVGSYGSGTAWSHDNKFIAMYGNKSNTGTVTIWGWDTTKPNDTMLRSKDSKTLGAEIYYARWSPDDRYFALCCIQNLGIANNFAIYEWNATLGKLIGPVANKTFKSATGGSAIAVAWSNNGRYIAVGGVSDGTNGSEPTNVMVYSWNGVALTQVFSQAFGSGAYFLQWSPDDQYLAVAGSNTTNSVIIYKVNFTTLAPTNPANAQSLFFGNSALGASYNPSINILNNALVNIQGKVFKDQA